MSWYPVVKEIGYFKVNGYLLYCVRISKLVPMITSSKWELIVQGLFIGVISIQSLKPI